MPCGEGWEGHAFTHKEGRGHVPANLSTKPAFPSFARAKGQYARPRNVVSVAGLTDAAWGGVEWVLLAATTRLRRKGRARSENALVRTRLSRPAPAHRPGGPWPEPVNVWGWMGGGEVVCASGSNRAGGRTRERARSALFCCCPGVFSTCVACPRRGLVAVGLGVAKERTATNGGPKGQTGSVWREVSFGGWDVKRRRRGSEKGVPQKVAWTRSTT